jgi:2'-5' RNA ligase
VTWRPTARAAHASTTSCGVWKPRDSERSHLRRRLAAIPRPARPSRTRRRAPPARRGLPVSWVAPDNFHVTVKFLGAVDEAATVRRHRRAPRAVPRHARFAIDVGGLRLPFRRQRERVCCGRGWWPAPVRSRRSPPPSIPGARLPSAFPREARAFSPHITVGARPRAAARARAQRHSLSGHPDPPVRTSAVDAVDPDAQRSVPPRGPLPPVSSRGPAVRTAPLTGASRGSPRPKVCIITFDIEPTGRGS